MITWHKIEHDELMGMRVFKYETVPVDNKLYLVKGSSGNVRHQTFLCVAYMDSNWRRGEWINVCGDRLSDNGWYPTHYAEIPEGFI